MSTIKSVIHRLRAYRCRQCRRETLLSACDVVVASNRLVDVKAVPSRSGQMCDPQVPMRRVSGLKHTDVTYLVKRRILLKCPTR